LAFACLSPEPATAWYHFAGRVLQKTPERNETRVERIWGFVFVVGVVAAFVLLAGYLVSLPTALWVAGPITLLASGLSVLALSSLAARRGGASIWRSLQSGIGDALRWLWHVTP
jgi:cobalamin biosynthesis protein CobD/CbiB